ncbi:hypothetical protein BV97_05665 [Novosphingobium resinovorum]|uniref:Uncharacterized protein n=1 Tax=Novosphingobium resinovorum TaxID=158500 RepID=A0A031J2H1_9SPHN|nr:MULTISPECIES: hypothetical protein [Novosphingobium]EZP68024.1 hypothetical protein BV97_05665 [Novosphingobium resinovorum]
MTECNSDDLAKGNDSADAANAVKFSEQYFRLSDGRREWLSVHLAPDAVTPFGARLLAALAAIDARLSGAGSRFVEELADIRYVTTQDDPAAWRAGFEQLVQKLGEILVARTLFEANWPDGTRFALEPTNPITGAKPEILIDTPAHQWLFEVKCPAFIDYQARRDANGRQLPVRSPIGDVPGMRLGTTLPRDNVLKDFLESAERKFRDFSNKPRTGLLVVLWDGHIFEATSALSHAEAGLLTDKSWHRRDGARVAFESVEGVIILNHLEVIKVAAQEKWRARQDDPLRIESTGQPPNVWCPNLGRDGLDPDLAQLFNAHPLDEVRVTADYAPNDFVLWIDPAAAARERLRAQRKRRLLGGTSSLTVRH